MVKKTVELKYPVAATARIAKANGAERIGNAATVALMQAAVDYTSIISQKANALAVHAGRKTIHEDDIALAIETL